MKLKYRILLISTLLAFFAYAQPAPDFSLSDVHGESFNLHNELGFGNTVVLDFFGLTCGSCQTDIGFLENIWQNHGAGAGQVQIWALESLGFDSYETNNFVSEYGGSFPRFALEGNNELLQLYQVTFIPRYFVICPNGSVKPSSVVDIEAHIEACESLTSIDDFLSRPEDVFHTNVSGNQLVVYFESQVQGMIKLELYDVMGRQHRSEPILAVAGFNQTTINVSGLPKGIFVVRLHRDKNFSASKRILIP